MTTRTDTLMIKLETDGDGKVKVSLANVEEGLEGVRKKSTYASRQFKQLRNDTQALTGKLKIMAVAAPAAFAFLADRSLAAADNIEKTAQKLGLGIEELQEWRYAAHAAGIEQATFDMAVQRFGRRVGEAASGTGELKDTLKRMKIEVRDSNGNIRAVNDILPEFLNKLSSVASASERNALAMKGFDSEGVKLVQLASRGAEGMSELRNRARELGIVLDEDLVRGASKTNERMDTLKTIIGTQVTGAFIQLAPEIDRFAKYLTEHTDEIKGFASDLVTIGLAAFEAAAEVAGFIAKVGQGLAIFASGANPFPYEKQIEGAKTKLQQFRTELENLRNSKTDQTPAIAGLEREIAKAEKRLEHFITLQNEAFAEQGKSLVGDPKKGAGDDDQSSAEKNRYTASLEGLISYADEAKTLTQERVTEFVRSLDTEIEAEQRRYEEGLLLLAEAREQGLEIEGGYYEAREALRLDHESRMAEMSEGFAQEWAEMWDGTLDRFSAGMGDAVANAVVEQQSLAGALQSVLKNVGKQVISTLIEIGVKRLILSQIANTTMAAEVVAATAAGAATAAAWAPAAAMTSLASFGANAAPAAAGIATTVGLSKTLAIAGQAHDGLEYVPNTGTYVLEGGELVGKKNENTRLTRLMDRIESGSLNTGSGDGGTTVMQFAPGRYTEQEVVEFITIANELARKGQRIVATEMVA